MDRKVKLSISNIGWAQADDRHMYGIMQELGFSGLEIAPTRVFGDRPYEKLDEMKQWKSRMELEYGISIASMQSIWRGRTEKIFGSAKERETLISYTKEAIRFAEVAGCDSLVFGCPSSRVVPDSVSRNVAVEFFRELGDYAYEHHTAIAMEANPPVYKTNFINTTEQAIELIEQVNSRGFLLNLDTGTMIANGEGTDVFKGKGQLISHVHISEPGLEPLRKRKLHQKLADKLREEGYGRFVSIETRMQDSMDLLSSMMRYVKEIFG